MTTDDQTAAEEAAQTEWEEMRTLAEEHDALRARAEAAKQRAEAAEADAGATRAAAARERDRMRGNVDAWQARAEAAEQRAEAAEAALAAARAEVAQVRADRALMTGLWLATVPPDVLPVLLPVDLGDRKRLATALDAMDLLARAGSHTAAARAVIARMAAETAGGAR